VTEFNRQGGDADHGGEADGARHADRSPIIAKELPGHASRFQQDG
jgi:hypothetical protein